MNAQAILARIEQDGDAARARLLRDAQAKADQARKASEQKIGAERDRCIEAARQDAVQLDDRLRRMARLDARKALLAAKRQVLDAAFDGALQKMREMPAEQARAFALAVLLRAAKGEETVVADAESAWCDQAFVNLANEALARDGKPGNLVLSKETRRMGGGFLLLSGGLEINCSFPAALSAQRMDLEPEIAALLFA